MHELENGTVSIRDGRVVLTATPFPKEQGRVTQGAIVANKLLAGALTEIKRRQEARITERLSARMTVREKAILCRGADPL